MALADMNGDLVPDLVGSYSRYLKVLLQHFLDLER